jgi:Xaa-Pro aminopeptidase
VAEKLQYYRSQQEGYVSESFNAIVGYKGNGAIVHYRADKDKCAQIKKEGILLVDSGGQYIDGTTDITRTMALSQPTAFQKQCYTYVLKGHIALDQAIFPKGTTGVQLDTFARQFLWNAGLNYGHGTGHGVGYFMNVHEPPQGIIPYPKGKGTTIFEAGMFTSNEPGYYHEGEFGIRIENLVLTVPHPTYKDFFKFENLTIYPIDKTLIDLSLMTSEEVNWVNTYHQHCWNTLSPHLSEAEKAWLEPLCAAL